MRRILTLTATVAVALTVNACEQPTDPVVDSARVEFKVTKLFDSNQFFPVAFVADNPCTPVVEAIAMSGTDHQIVKIWDNGNFKLHLQFNLSGTDGAGLQYRLTDTVNLQDHFGTSGTFTATANTHAISQGSQPNFIANAHITVNANGDVTVDFFDFECRG